MAHERGFNAHSPFAVMLYVYLVAIVFTVWQVWTRSKLEKVFKPQLQAVAQPMGATMLWFARLQLLAFVLRALWVVLKEGEWLADDDSCANSYKCPKVVVTTINRAASFVFFIAYALIVLLWIRWGKQCAAATGAARHKGAWDTLFLVLGVWMLLLQVVVLLLTLFANLSEDTVDGKLHDVFIAQVAIFLVIIVLSMSFAGFLVLRLLTRQLRRYRDWQARTTVPDVDDLPIPTPPAPSRTHLQGLASPSTSVVSFNTGTSGRPVAFTQSSMEDDDATWQRGRSCCGRAFACLCCRRRPDDLTQNPNNPTVQLLRRARWVVLMTCLVVVPLSVIKAVMFAYRPLSGTDITGTAGDVMYPYFFYLVPEVGSGVLLLTITTPHYRGSWVPCLGMCQGYASHLERTRDDDTMAFDGDTMVVDPSTDVDARLADAADPTTTTVPLLYSDIMALKQRARTGDRNATASVQRSALDSPLQPAASPSGYQPPNGPNAASAFTAVGRRRSSGGSSDAFVVV